MLRILYAGSPDCAVQPLVDIAKSLKHQVVGVLTNPAQPKGRSGEPLPTPVALAVTSLNQELTGLGKPPILLTPEKLDETARQAVEALKPDILVCYAYGKLFGPKFRGIFPRGGINLHPSLLPRYRGCAPVPAAILNQDSETGITIQRIGAEMDAGPVLLQKTIPLAGTETCQHIFDIVSREGGNLLLQVLDALENGQETETAQNNDEATYCAMMRKEQGQIDWHRSATEIDAKIRAYTPWPGTFTSFNGLQLRIHQAKALSETDVCLPSRDGERKPKAGTVLAVDKKYGILIQTGNGILAVFNLQLQAKKAMNWQDFINGNKTIIGSIVQ